MPADKTSDRELSRRYQDYVIKDGRLVGDFDAMYQNSSDIPWHQDKTAYTLFSDFDLAILGHFSQGANWQRVLDVGCGLGYLTTRLHKALPGSEVHGADISETAIAKAREMHPQVTFHTADLRSKSLPELGQFDLIFMKDILWYVLPEIDTFFYNLNRLLSDGGWCYISQSVPSLPNFYGMEQFPNTTSILGYCARLFERRYASSTYDTGTHRVVGIYEVDKYARFLGQARKRPASNTGLLP